MPGAWLTIECETEQPTTDNLVAALDVFVRTWSYAAKQYRNTYAANNSTDTLHPSSHLSQPVSGFDYVKWHLDAQDMQTQALAI